MHTLTHGAAPFRPSVALGVPAEPHRGAGGEAEAAYNKLVRIKNGTAKTARLARTRYC